jgi:hypothetical protein
MTATAIVGAVCALSVGLGAYGLGVLSSDLFYRDLVALLVGAAAYTSLFVLVSLLINKAMIVSLLYAFAWETSVPSIPGDTYKLAITSHLTAIAERPTTASEGLLGALSSGLSTNLLSPAVSWPVLILLIAACSAIGAAWFTKFEYVGREDTE